MICIFSYRAFFEFCRLNFSDWIPLKAISNRSCLSRILLGEWKCIWDCDWDWGSLSSIEKEMLLVWLFTEMGEMLNPNWLSIWKLLISIVLICYISLLFLDYFLTLVTPFTLGYTLMSTFYRLFVGILAVFLALDSIFLYINLGWE